MDGLTIDEAINHARKVALEKSSEMAERVIGRLDTSDCKKCMEQHERLAEWLEELKAYMDLEEQGKLLKLPCVVGDTVWELCKCDDGIYRIFPMKVTKVVPYGSIRWIKGKEPAIWNVYAVSDYTDMYKSFYDFGKTVFLTQEEAESALKKMEGSK